MSNQCNPLIIPILEIIKSRDSSLTEYELIGLLQRQLQSITEISVSKSLALFQTHFLVMNGLYQLQNQLIDDNYHLVISPLNIVLQPREDSGATALTDVEVTESLRRYYLDWSNFEETSEQDVGLLLDSFWQYYLAEDKQVAAYRILDLEPGADWTSVQKSYRRLVAAKHPDRGGNNADFVVVREAYEVLACVYNK